jgi:hypothetical protein
MKHSDYSVICAGPGLVYVVNDTVRRHDPLTTVAGVAINAERITEPTNEFTPIIHANDAPVPSAPGSPVRVQDGYSWPKRLRSINRQIKGFGDFELVSHYIRGAMIMLSKPCNYY